jgi:hypothetical protein
LTYILGFVALEIPRAGTDPQTSDEYVRRMWAFFAALPPGEFVRPRWPASANLGRARDWSGGRREQVPVAGDPAEGMDAPVLEFARKRGS